MGRAPALIVVALAACDGATPAPDAPVDADLVDFPLTGTFLDWDSTAATPCPIAGATWVAHYDDQRSAITDTDGTFTLRLASYATLLDVTPPKTAATCASGTYVVPGIAISPPAVVLGGGVVVARAFTQSRMPAFDATRGALLIHVIGAPRAFSISAPHAPEQAFDGTAWATGAIGTDVYFPSIDVPITKLTIVTVAGDDAIGLGSVPLAAGAITYMTAILR